MDLPDDAGNPFVDDSDPFAGPPDPRLPDPAEKAPQTAQEPPSAPPPAALPEPSEAHDPTPEEIRLAFDRANEASTPPAPQTNGSKGRKKGAAAKPPEEPAVRLAPQDLAAEVGVLGSIVLNNDVAFEVFAAVQEADFFTAPHRALYAAMLALHEDAVGIDSLTLVDRLRVMGTLGIVGGSEAVAALLDAVPTSAHALHYAKIVRAKSLRRAQIVEGERLIAAALQEAGDDTDPVQVLSEASTRLLEIAHGATDEKVECIGGGDLLKMTIDRPELLIGADDLKASRPLAKGQLMVIGGPPKLGKSLLASELAIQLAKPNGSWLGLPVHGPKRTLVIEAEGGLDLVQDWLKQQAAHLPDEVLNRIRIPGKLPKIDLTKPKSVMLLRRIIECEEAALTWLDPFFRLHRADENDNNEMRDVMAALEEIRSCTKTAMAMVHHVARLIMENAKGRATVRLRGGSVVDADLDSLLMIDYPDEDQVDSGATYLLYWDIRRGPKPPNQIIFRDPETLMHRASALGAKTEKGSKNGGGRKGGNGSSGGAPAPAPTPENPHGRPQAALHKSVMEFLWAHDGKATPEDLAIHLRLPPPAVKEVVKLMGFSVRHDSDSTGAPVYRIPGGDKEPPPNHPDRELFGGKGEPSPFEDEDFAP